MGQALLVNNRVNCFCAMQSCLLCGSGPFSKEHFKKHELTKKHLKALAVQQEKSQFFKCDKCSYETVHKCHWARHELIHKKPMEISSKEQRLKDACAEVKNHVLVEELLPKKSKPGAFDESKESAMDEGLKKAADFFTKPNILRKTCACCYELLFKSKDVITVLAEGSWLERLKKRLRWEHTTFAVSEPTRAFYQAPATAVDLMGIPLAPSGITVTVLKCYVDRYLTNTSK